jgi:hypothetical protein
VQRKAVRGPPFRMIRVTLTSDEREVVDHPVGSTNLTVQFWHPAKSAPAVPVDSQIIRPAPHDQESEGDARIPHTKDRTLTDLRTTSTKDIHRTAVNFSLVPP